MPQPLPIPPADGSIAAPAYRPAGAVYRPRRPTETPLYLGVHHHLETYLAEAQEADPTDWGPHVGGA